jgi:hypothetical protein
MNVRPYVAEDYNDMHDWWIGHGWPMAIQEELLPPDGAVVEGVAGAFLYRTNARATCICWPISNPEVENKIEVYKALEEIFVYLRDKTPEGDMCVCFAPTDGIKRMLDKLGFEGDCEDNNGMIYVKGYK